jgi:tRNA(Ile)-lysidine synthase
MRRAPQEKSRSLHADDAPVSAQEARRLLAALAGEPAVVLAVSGGPDSLALMWLAARWRRARKRGPELVAVTVDHGLRPDAAREAREVKRLAGEWGLAHHTRRWRGDKPETGLPAAAREARYALLASVARRCGARCIVTAHTRDDQAETVVMRLARGSGLTGLRGMAQAAERDGVTLLRPLLDVGKARLIATLQRAGIAYADDPTNRDPHYTRPRWRALMPVLAEQGADARTLARLALRLGRADAALELMADAAERYLALNRRDGARLGVEAAAFAALAEEIRVRLLLRAIDRAGEAGRAELGKVEALADALAVAARDGVRLKQTLAGALISLERGRIRVATAPPRRPVRSKSS